MAVYYATSSCTTSTTSATGNVWVTWCDNSTSSASTSTVWTNWVGTGSTTTSVTTDSTWATWVIADGSVVRTVRVPTAAAPVMTQAQSAEALARQAEALERRREEAAKQVKEREAAAAKAMELLHQNLSEKQSAALKKHGWFLVEGGKSKKTYRIYGDRCAGNIHELDAEQKKEIARYCVHAEYSIPLGDQLLAQAICLRLDEDHLIKTANKTQLAA